MPELLPLEGYPHRPAHELMARAEGLAAEFATRRTVREFSAEPVPEAVMLAAIRAAATAPSGANQQPWHFCLIGQGPLRRRLRLAAEAEERAFYAGRAGEEWLKTLGPLGTDWQKPFLEAAPWLIAIFAERWGEDGEGERRKHYYVAESVGIASGLLIATLHHAGLATLTHTPSPMGFLSRICGRPPREKPFLLLVAGYPAPDARTPAAARVKRAARGDREPALTGDDPDLGPAAARAGRLAPWHALSRPFRRAITAEPCNTTRRAHPAGRDQAWPCGQTPLPLHSAP